MTASRPIDVVKIASRLPTGDRNGLNALAAALAEKPTGTYVVAALVDCSQIVERVDIDERTATARIRAIEVLTGTADTKVRDLMLRAGRRRTGYEQLSFDDLETDAGAAAP